MRLALPALLPLLLAACTAKVPPRTTPLIPAATDILIGLDLAAVMSANVYASLEPGLADTPIPLWLTASRECGLDPLRSRATLLVGTNGTDVAAQITGRGLGDADKLRCVAAHLTPHAASPPFDVRDPAGPLADHDLVATVADANTVVFTTRGWTTAVDDILHDRGGTTPVDLTHPQFARADRTAHVWFAGRLPPTFRSIRELPDTETLTGRLDLGDDLRAAVVFDLGDPGYAAEIAEHLPELISMARAISGLALGHTSERDPSAATMQGDELHVELTLGSPEVLERVPGVLRASLWRTTDPRKFLAIGGRYTFANYPPLLEFPRKQPDPAKPAGGGLFGPPESPCALAWSDPPDMFVQSIERNALLLAAAREGVAQIRCDHHDTPIIVRAATTMTIEDSVKGVLAVTSGEGFSLGVDLFDADGHALEIGERTDIEWSIKGVVRPDLGDSAAILGLNPYSHGRSPVRTTAVGEGGVRARFGDLQAEVVVHATAKPAAPPISP